MTKELYESGPPWERGEMSSFAYGHTAHTGYKVKEFGKFYAVVGRASKKESGTVTYRIYIVKRSRLAWYWGLIPFIIGGLLIDRSYRIS